MWYVFMQEILHQVECKETLQINGIDWLPINWLARFLFGWHVFSTFGCAFGGSPSDPAINISAKLGIHDLATFLATKETQDSNSIGSYLEVRGGVANVENKTM